MAIFSKKSNELNNGAVKLIEKVIQNPDNIIEYKSNTVRDLDEKPTSSSYVYSVKSKDGTEIIKIELHDRYQYDSKFLNKPSSHKDSYLFYLNGEHTYMDDKKAKKLYNLMQKEHSSREASHIKTKKAKDATMAFLEKYVRE